MPQLGRQGMQSMAKSPPVHWEISLLNTTHPSETFSQLYAMQMFVLQWYGFYRVKTGGEQSTYHLLIACQTHLINDLITERFSETPQSCQIYKHSFSKICFVLKMEHTQHLEMEKSVKKVLY